MKFFLKILFTLLLFFIVFSFAGAEPWSFSVLQVGILVAFTCWSVSAKRTSFSPLTLCSMGGLFFLAVYSIVQALFYTNLLSENVWHPVSFMPLYSLEHASLFVTYAVTIFFISKIANDTKNVRTIMWIIASCGLLLALLVANTQNGDYIHFFTGITGGVGPFLNRNHAGVFLAMVTIVLCGLLSSYLTKYKSYPSEKKKLFCVGQVAGWIAVIGLIVSCIFTRSRGGMLSLLMGLCSFTFLCICFSVKEKVNKIKWLAVWTLVVAVIFAWIFTHLDAINIFAQRAVGVSVDIRMMLYRAAWKLILLHPVWGIGIGAMPVVITSYMDFPINSYVERLHCDWLELLLGAGSVGSFVVVLCVGWFLWVFIKQCHKLNSTKKVLLCALLSATVSMCVGSIVDFHFFIPANAFLFFSIVGLMTSNTFAEEEKIKVYHAKLLPLVLGVLMLLAVIGPLKKTIAWRDFLFGKNLKTSAQLALYENGVATFPSPRYATKLGNAYYNAGLHAKDATEKQAYFKKAHVLAETYLKKYPKEKELSKLYLRTR